MTDTAPLTQDALYRLARHDVPPAILAHPGMIGEPERRALYGLASAYWRPGTAIIDAGAFLGASTRLFLEALRERAVGAPSVYSYEYGVFNPFNAGIAGQLLGGEFAAGQPFGDLLQRLVSDGHGEVKYHIGDIRDFPYDGPAISLAFLDILKGTSLMDYVYSAFVPRFTPETIVYQQDYFHPFHPWIAFSMEVMRDAFTFVGRLEPDVREINGALFAVNDIALLPREFDMASAGKSEVIDALDSAIAAHDDPVEKLHMVGLRCTGEGCFTKDADYLHARFDGLLADLNLSYLLEDESQNVNVGKIRHFISLFGNDPNLTWA